MSSQEPTRPIRLLLVEDNPADVDLTLEALEESPLDVETEIVRDGEKALQYLHRQPPYEEAIRPDLILLDLNLPRKDGREVLEDIKQDRLLRTIPVVVLTTSASDEDILKAYEGYANCYITKPVMVDNFIEVIKAIEGFWGTVVRLPQS